MKKSFQLFAIGAMMFSTAFISVQAQDNTVKKAPQKKEFQKVSPEQRADHFIEKISKDLSLTENQKTQIKALKLKEMQEHKALQEKHQSIREKYHSEFKKILSEQQIQKLEELKKERKEQFQNREKGKYGPHQFQHKDERPAPKK